MDGKRFDRMVARLAAARNRRGLLQLLLALAGLFPLLAVNEAHAEKGSGGRKGGKRHGRHRPRRRHARRRQKQKKNKKNDQPQPECSPDGLSSQCGANQLCVEGACQPCTVTCDGDPGACGDALRAAIAAAPSAPIVVCPGRYGGNFVIDAGVEIIGAGDGEDPGSDTILDAQGQGRVLVTTGGGAGNMALERLRITGGGGNDGLGGGIVNLSNRTLALTRCTVSGNQTTSPGDGGGIFNAGTMTLIDCRIEENSATHGGGIVCAGNGFTTLTGNTQVRGNTAVMQGGGFFVDPGSAVTIGADCRVTENSAPDGEGGGIYSFGGTVDLANDQIVTGNNGGNCASAGPSIDNCDG